MDDKDFGLDYRVDNAYLEVLINDLPIVDPGFDIGTSAAMESNIDFKHFLYDGKNNIKFITRKVDNEKEAVLKLSFKTWDEGDFYMPFEVSSNGFVITFDYEDGSCSLDSNSDSIKVESRGCHVKTIENGYLLDIKFDLDYTGFYESKYISEAILINDSDLIKSKLVDEYKKIFSFYKDRDWDALEEYLSPMLNKQAEDTGWSKKEIFKSLYGKYLVDNEFSLSNFDLSDTYIYITGDNKLFSIVENPFRLVNEKTTEFTMPIFYFWLDKSGEIRIKQ
ncbi:hypothetical protein [Neptunomonas phycophila]|uniref:hypothetical protein n=1 Tax=Neptunomonas phycophila TaxID=1572645 RepID=UPI001BEBA7EC|nr:hypothetical protein [Neptunomonas phycophila]MBT3145568.1 hypothetical protein [Neptunomonas phycophila]